MSVPLVLSPLKPRAVTNIPSISRYLAQNRHKKCMNEGLKDAVFFLEFTTVNIFHYLADFYSRH